jgi:hypothetical protein
MSSLCRRCRWTGKYCKIHRWRVAVVAIAPNLKPRRRAHRPMRTLRGLSLFVFVCSNCACPCSRTFVSGRTPNRAGHTLPDSLRHSNEGQGVKFPRPYGTSGTSLHVYRKSAGLAEKDRSSNGEKGVPIGCMVWVPVSISFRGSIVDTFRRCWHQ